MVRGEREGERGVRVRTDEQAKLGELADGSERLEHVGRADDLGPARRGRGAVSGHGAVEICRDWIGEMSERRCGDYHLRDDSRGGFAQQRTSPLARQRGGICPQAVLGDSQGDVRTDAERRVPQLRACFVGPRRIRRLRVEACM